MGANCTDSCAGSRGYMTYLQPRQPAKYTSIDQNCYPGQGANDIAHTMPPPVGISAVSCAEQCGVDKNCTCFVYQPSEGKCWKRTNCTPSSGSCANDGPDYMTFVESKAPSNY